MERTVEKIELYEDYLDKIKRKTNNREVTLYFAHETAQAQLKEEGKVALRSYLTFSAIVENTLFLNTNLLQESICAGDEDIKTFQAKAKELENAAIDRAKKECPNCRMVRGVTNFV